MTIPYALRVATCRGIGNFYRLLVWVPGSVYRMVWRNMLYYFVAYYSLNIFYRFILLEFEVLSDWEELFRKVVMYFRRNNSRIPLVFVLSFFVGIVNERWWTQILLIPWPDSTCIQFSALVHGQDRRGRMIRRNLARYLNLSLVFAFEHLSEQVRLRFPDTKAYVEAGLLLPHEAEILKRHICNFSHPSYIIPLIWTNNLIYLARKEGRIYTPLACRNLINRMLKLRGKLLELINYQRVFVPLSYTQVAMLAVYVYFTISVIGNQFVDEATELDMYIPYFAFIEFFFFIGWLKIAEAMLNPYGSDDDDFEINWMIDRNFQVSYLLVDEIHRAVPAYSRDFYFETVLRKPYYIKTPNVDGTYSDEVPPPPTKAELAEEKKLHKKKMQEEKERLEKERLEKERLEKEEEAEEAEELEEGAGQVEGSEQQEEIGLEDQQDMEVFENLLTKSVVMETDDDDDEDDDEDEDDDDDDEEDGEENVDDTPGDKKLSTTRLSTLTTDATTNTATNNDDKDKKDQDHHHDHDHHHGHHHGHDHHQDHNDTEQHQDHDSGEK